MLYSRYFADADAERIAFWLFCPVDSIVMKRMRELGERPGVYQISGIDSSPQVLSRPGHARRRRGAGRSAAVWFDDNWGDRERDAS